MTIPCPSEAPMSAAHEARSLRILVADDNATNQLLATHLLGKRGHAVVTAANGVEALAAFAREAFDVVLMDVEMPEMNGLDAARAIRRAEEGTGRHIPIIAVSAYATKGHADACLAAGMDAHLPKPLKQGVLLDEIHRALGWGAPSPAPAPAAPPRRAVDREALLASVDGDLEFLRELLALFPSEIPRQLADVQGSVARGNAPALSRTAHALRGALENFGARPAAGGARRLEQMGQEGDLAGADQALAELTRDINRVGRELEIARTAAL